MLPLRFGKCKTINIAVGYGLPSENFRKVKRSRHYSPVWLLRSIDCNAVYEVLVLSPSIVNIFFFESFLPDPLI